MKILLLCVASFSFLQNAHGQVYGKLITASGESIPFASVLLLNQGDSSLAKGILTNEIGEYEISGINAGQYFLRLSAVGFKTSNSPTFSLVDSQISKNFGTQVMEENTEQLQEIVIQAERPLYQQEIDRTVINVESSVLTKGSSALQLLERSPGVYVDMRNNSIALNGKSHVLVMLNGKLMRLPMTQVVALLNSMSANDIEKIELLTTPPAKYDADGNAGMINIVLKKQEEVGTNGSFSVTGGHGWREKGTSSINLAHNTGKVNTFASYSFSHDRTQGGWIAESTQTMPALGGEISVDFWNNEKVISNNQNATLGIDLNMKKATMGSSITYSSSQVVRAIFNRAEYNIIEADSLLLMRAIIDGNTRWRNLIANVYLEKKISATEKINADVDYLNYSNSNPTEASTTFFSRSGNEVAPAGSIFSNHQKGVSHAPIHVGVIKIDYSKQLNKKLKLETGIKGTFTRSSSFSKIENLVNDEWIGGSRTTNAINMSEGIGAGYSSFHFQLNPSVNLVAGARYEYSHTRMEADKEENMIDRKVGKLFPSFFFSKKLTDLSDIQLSYTKRIGRPSYNDLASYLLYIDPMAVFTGNPSLRPTVTNNLKIGYSYSGYSFSILASRDNYPIVWYQLRENATRDLMYVAPQNMAYQNNLTFQTNVPLKVTNWWSMSYGFVGGLRQFKLAHTKDKFEKTYVAYSLNGSQTFEFPKSISLEISGWYNTAQYDGSKKVDGFGMLNAGIKKELKNNWGSIQVAVSDLLKSMRITSYFGQLTEEAFSLQSQVTYSAESANNRIVKFTYFRSFGNNKVNGQKSRSAVSKDERDRIKKD